METRKIGIACFIGGAIGVIVALLVAPMFWWLGLLSGIAAGFLTGYVAYDVKEFFRKMPTAWTSAKFNTRSKFSATLNALETFFQDKLPQFGKLIIRPRPIIHFALGCSTLLVISWIVYGEEFKTEFDNNPIKLIMFFATVEIIMIAFFGNIALWGLKTEKITLRFDQFWFTDHIYRGDNIKDKLPLTYRMVARGFLKGLFLVPFWIVIVKIIKMSGYFSKTFVCKFTKLIYSQKRLLCGVWSAIGTTISFICLYQQNLQIGAALLIVACGGILGAVLGIANYELLSKRLLRRYLPHIS